MRSLLFAIAIVAMALGLWLLWPALHRPAASPSVEPTTTETPAVAAPPPHTAHTSPGASSVLSAPSVVGSSTASAAIPSPEEFFGELRRLTASDRNKAIAYARAGEHWFGTEGEAATGVRAMLISLLVDNSQMDEARERTRAFIVTYPSSSYRALVQGLTGIHPRPTGPNSNP